jgi:uncharacterized membrane protein
MTGAATAVRVRWIHRDGPRGLIGAVVCVVAAIVFSMGFALITGRGPSTLITTYVSWDVFAISQIVLVLLAYARATPQQLPDLLRHTGTRRRAANLWSAGEGPGTAVTLAVIALVGAVVLPRISGVDAGGRLAETLVIASGVILSWIVVVVSFTVFYARRAIQHGGLEFPGGDPEQGWVDYLYFALSVSSTFGTTDVTVTTTRMRRSVLSHAAIAFVFNTVILAILVGAVAS